MQAPNKGLWYFAHPYTVRDADGRYVPEAEEANFRLCCIRAARLLQAGYNVYAPICHTRPIHRACPEFLANHEHAMWYGLDNELIDRCAWTGLILAPLWEHSEGCCGERDTFLRESQYQILTYRQALVMAEPLPEGIKK